MAGAQRNPPKPHSINLIPTQSEPDINSASKLNDYVTSRHKRPRPEYLSRSQHDIQDLFDTWKRDQDNRITKSLEDKTALISTLATDISEIKAQNIKIQESNAEISETNAEIELSMTFMNQNFEDLKKEVEELKKERLEQRGYTYRKSGEEDY